MSGDCTFSATAPPISRRRLARRRPRRSRGIPARRLHAVGGEQRLGLRPRSAPCPDSASALPTVVAHRRRRSPAARRGGAMRSRNAAVIGERLDRPGAARHRGVAGDADLGEGGRSPPRRRGRVGRTAGSAARSRRRCRPAPRRAFGAVVSLATEADQQDRVDALAIAARARRSAHSRPRRSPARSRRSGSAPRRRTAASP